MTESMNAPSHFGRYQVKRVLGEGQMGSVYLAEELLFGRGGALPAELAVFVRNLERFAS